MPKSFEEEIRLAHAKMVKQIDADLDELIDSDGDNKSDGSEREKEALVQSSKPIIEKDKTTKATRADVRDEDDETPTKPTRVPAENKCLILYRLTCLLISSKFYLFLGFCLVVMAVLVVMLITAARSAKQLHRDATIEHDYSDVKSIYDLKLGKIDHWCIFGGDDGCACDDPLDPMSHSEIRGWMKAHKMNKRLIKQAVREGKEIDVAFVGDSITEEWHGRWLGTNHSRFERIPRVFNKWFKRTEGNDTKSKVFGKYDGIPLGVAGDTSVNLLWRLMHGEMPDDFNPKVWWLLIGINDLGKQGCSEEVTLLGILRVIEEIQARKPDAMIVVNALFPTSASYHERLDAVIPSPKQATSNKKKKRSNDDFKEVEPSDDAATKMRQPFRIERKRTYLDPSVKSINKELKRFCDKHKRVKYFDIAPLFYSNDGGKRTINKQLMLDGVHPTETGHNLWAKKITQRLDVMLSKGEVTQSYNDYGWEQPPAPKASEVP